MDEADNPGVHASPTAAELFRDEMRTVVVAAFRSPVVVLAYGLPVVVAAAIIAIVQVALGGPARLVNGHLDWDRTLPLAVLVVESVLAALIEAFAAAAATAALVARVGGHRITLSSAWARGLRRLPAVVVPRVLATVVVVILIAAALAATYFWGAGPGIFVAALGAIALLCILPLVLASAIAAVSDLGPFAAVGAAFRTRSRIALTGLIIVGGGAVVGVHALTGLAVEPLLGGIGAGATWVVGLAAGVLAIGVTGWLTLESPARPVSLTPALRPAHPAGAALGAIGVMILPGLLVASLLIANPLAATVVSVAEAPTFSTASVSSMGPDRTVWFWGSQFDSDIGACSPAACARPLAFGGRGTAAMQELSDGSLLVAGWQDNDRDATAGPARLDVARVTPGDFDAAGRTPERFLVLTKVASPSRAIATVQGEQEPEAWSWEHAVSIARRGGRTVIASLDPIGPPDHRTGERFTLFRCADERCDGDPASSSVTVPGWSGTDSAKFSGMDVALSADGTAYAVVADDENVNALRLVVVPPTGDPVLRVLEANVPDALNDAWTFTGNEASAQSARIAVDDAGHVTIAYRHGMGRVGDLYRCADASCDHWETTQLLPDTGTSLTATLATDRSGRPMFAAIDRHARTVVLRSCDDASCSTWHSRTLGRIKGVDDVALTLDGRGHPIVLASPLHPSPSDSGQIFRCAEARCGAP